MDAKIAVEGLAEVNRALRKLDKEAPKGLRLAGNEAASLLIDRTRPLIPRVSGRAAKSLAARSTRTSSRVAMGGPRAPYTPWLDFGGEGRRRGRPPARPFLKEGRYLYPTLRRVRPEIERTLDAALSQVIRDAGLDA